MIWKNPALFPGLKVSDSFLMSRPLLYRRRSRLKCLISFSVPSCVLYFLPPGFNYNLLLQVFFSSCHAVQLQKRRNAETGKTGRDAKRLSRVVFIVTCLSCEWMNLPVDEGLAAVHERRVSAQTWVRASRWLFTFCVFGKRMKLSAVCWFGFFFFFFLKSEWLNCIELNQAWETFHGIFFALKNGGEPKAGEIPVFWV